MKQKKVVYIEIYKKDPTKFKVKPNLENYEKTYKKFKWEDVHSEIEWFENNKLNAAYNAVDRHAQAKSPLKDKVALIWENEEHKEKNSIKFTFTDLSNLSNKFANVLKKNGVVKGDRVFIFLPRIPELYISFLGILKTGAIAGELFAAFGPDALLDRLGNSEAKVLITDSELKKRIDKVRDNLPALKQIIVVGDKPNKKKGELSYYEEMQDVDDKFEIEKMNPEDYAFMLYTSGTTGKPKGVVHCHYAILQEHITTKWILDLHPEDIYWCTADPGWVTGISYGILGPWSNGITSIVYRGRFSPEDWYFVIEKHKVTVLYTAPTAVRMLMRMDDVALKKHSLKSLRYLCSVGEPLNPEAIKWGIEKLNLAFHDNWWQTETGSILIANYPCMDIKLGSMGKPFPGIKAAIVDDDENELPDEEEGNLVIKPGWPSMMRTIWKNKAKYKEYFKKGWYITGDRAYRDKDGYFVFVGRADDVINTAGHRVGPFEVESALIEHPAIAEAGVIGKPDPLYGEIIKAFVTLNPDYRPSKELEEDIKKFIKTKLAGHAYPKEFEFRESLPKTRSGKIMRRVLKAQELGEEIGDISTLEK